MSPPKETSVTDDFNFYAHDFQSDPGPTFALMIEDCPFHHSEKWGWYSVFRYADVQRIADDNATYSAKYGPGVDYAPADRPAVLVSADPPLHTIQRRAIVQAFNSRTIRAMEPGLREFVTGLIDRVIDQGHCDLIQDIAVPVPLWIICNFLGLPYEANAARFRGWVEVMAASVLTQDKPEMRASGGRAAMEIAAFFTPIIEQHMRQVAAGEDPGDHLLGVMAKADVDGNRLTLQEMLGFAQFLLVAGSGTTTNLIGNFFKLMLDHPEQRARLETDSRLMDQAIEEVLRFDAPVHGLFRTNNEPVQLGDLEVPTDSKICLMWGSANRDPEVFDRPNEFDIGRDLYTLRKNMTFGWGIHKCIGAPLARLECRVVVEEITLRMPNYQAGGRRVPYPYATLNGLDHLDLKW